MAEPLTARILEIQRMSTEDGPGLRTTAFFKGCPLRCTWCHNPESIDPGPQLQWVGSRCIGCLTCLSVCPEKALTRGPAGIEINRDQCTACGLCADECPTTAMEILGTVWTVEDLAGELARDRAYFEKSGGGVTLSGGEPTLAGEFTLALAERLRDMGLHVALDTCGLCPTDRFQDMVRAVDMVLFDIKTLDPARHKALTGSSNTVILENFGHAVRARSGSGRPRALWVRTPIIPGATDDPGNIAAIAGFLAESGRDHIDRWELCAFNNLCRDKYLRLGRTWAFADTPLVTRQAMEALEQAGCAAGMDALCHWTGNVQKDDTP